ncbi:GerW family sporulation protein [Oscillospiraceae bacterium PP1C4]
MSNGSHPINGLMDSSLQNLRSLVDADTVIGEAITTPDGIVIIPVSKVSFGFASGGSDLPTNKQNELFGGGAGGGVSVQPLGFLVIKDGQVDLLQMNDNKTTADRVVTMMPEIVDKLSAMFTKKDKKAKTSDKPSEKSTTEINIDL